MRLRFAKEPRHAPKCRRGAKATLAVRIAQSLTAPPSAELREPFAGGKKDDTDGVFGKHGTLYCAMD
jgi:hypothetical protein